DFVVAHTGFEPVISALRGRRPRPLDQCATMVSPRWIIPNHLGVCQGWERERGDGQPVPRATSPEGQSSVSAVSRAAGQGLVSAVGSRDDGAEQFSVRLCAVADYRLRLRWAGWQEEKGDQRAHNGEPGREQRRAAHTVDER